MAGERTDQANRIVECGHTFCCRCLWKHFEKNRNRDPTSPVYDCPSCHNEVKASPIISPNLRSVSCLLQNAEIVRDGDEEEFMMSVAYEFSEFFEGDDLSGDLSDN